MRIFFYILVAGCMAACPATAQKIPVNQLCDMLNWDQQRLDTTLHKLGYQLMQRSVDSTSALYQYSFIDRTGSADALTLVWAFTYMDVSVHNLKSRLVTYRTYDETEYRAIAGYLAENGYRLTQQFSFGQDKHYLYSNDTLTIRVKVIPTRLKDGRVFTAYELELGK